MTEDKEQSLISKNSRRIARNSVALYIRMFFLMLVGLFTARVVLGALGAQDRGVYEAVGSFVSLMAIITNSFSTAISRFLTVEIAKGDKEGLRKVFANAGTIIAVVAAMVVLAAEPLGTWYVGERMNLPPGRSDAALWVFHFSLATFVINLFSIPYNAAIIAHEKMSAFAVIGVVEGCLKLGVALLLTRADGDKLILYAALMCAVALTVRLLYAAYCRRSFPESKAGFALDREVLGKMSGFAGWNGLSSGVYLVNTYGVTLLLNRFFGVVFNTMRGIAFNVEAMVKQFVTNVITAINPQITKSWSSGDKAYAFDLACKGSKYAFLIVFAIALPFWFEAETLLRLWLGDSDVPQGTALFTRLTLICLILDLLMTTLSTLIQAEGRIRRFYIAVSSLTALIFPLTWVLFKNGAPACSMYIVFIAVYLLNDAMKLLVLRREIGFPVGFFVRQVLLRVLPVAAVSLAVSSAVWLSVPEGWWRFGAVLCSGGAAVCLTTYAFALSDGERAFVVGTLKRLRRSAEKQYIRRLPGLGGSGDSGRNR